MKKSIFIFFGLTFLIMTSCGNTGGNNPGGTKEGTVIYLTTDMFKKMVWDYTKNPNSFVYLGSKPCIIDFYADWCKPCKMVAPIMEELATEYKGKLIIYKVNTDQERELSSLFRIQSIPAILYVPQTGQPQMAVGLQPKTSYVEAITNLLNVK
jgi:thioredoxin 1